MVRYLTLLAVIGTALYFEPYALLVFFCVCRHKAGRHETNILAK